MARLKPDKSITAYNFIPYKAGNGNVGMTSSPFLNIHSKNFFIYNGNGVQVGKLEHEQTGTTDTAGLIRFTIDNNKASGSEDNSVGHLSLYDTTAYFITSQPKKEL